MIWWVSGVEGQWRETTCARNDTQAWANAVHHLTCHKSFSPNNDRISRRCFRVPIIAFAYAADRNASQAFKYSQGRGLQHSTRPYMCLRHTRPFFLVSPVSLYPRAMCKFRVAAEIMLLISVVTVIIWKPWRMRSAAASPVPLKMPGAM